MRARWSIATNRNPQDERKRSASSIVFEHFGETVAVQLAGQPIVAPEKSKLTLLLVALVDDADDAKCALRLAVRAGKPAAGILDP
jgi:hypothetical protein